MLGEDRRTTDLDMVLVGPAHLGERVVGEMVVPLSPVFRVKKFFNFFRACERDGRPRMVGGPVGMRGEEHHNIAVNALGEDRCGFRIKGRDEMPFGEMRRRIADGERDLDVIGAEGIAAERGVEAIPAAFKESDARIFAAELFPRFLRYDDLLARMEVDAVFGKGRADGGHLAERRLERARAPERAIKDPHTVFGAHRRRIKRRK